MVCRAVKKKEKKELEHFRPTEVTKLADQTGYWPDPLRRDDELFSNDDKTFLTVLWKAVLTKLFHRRKCFYSDEEKKGKYYSKKIAKVLSLVYYIILFFTT